MYLPLVFQFGRNETWRWGFPCTMRTEHRQPDKDTGTERAGAKNAARWTLIAAELESQRHSGV
jgi:hypothetical protein